MDTGEYLIWIFLTSVWCWGFHNAFEDDQIFFFIGKWARRNIHENWLKPFIGCPICMASVHGTFWYWYSQTQYAFLTWIMFIVAASGINYVIYNLFPPSDIDVKNHY